MARHGFAGTAAGPGASGTALSEAVIAWAKGRGISRRTLEALHVRSATEGGCEVLCFPHFRDGREVGCKFRALTEKRFWCRSGSELRFWNLEQVLGGKTVYITEGELDACALVESGISPKEVVSLPNGANDNAAEDPISAAGYGYVRDALSEGLSEVNRFVLCTDADGPGHAVRHDLVRILGVARCWYVDWPEGAKDANDLLRSDGPAAVRELVTDGAQAWPCDGLYRLDELPDPPPLTLWEPGFPEWESKLCFAPRTLSVVSGHPGHGKTVLMMQIWAQICRQYGLKAAIASFETLAKPHHARNIRSSYWRRLDKDLTEDERAEADTWNREHFLWIVHPRYRPDLRWLLDTAEVAAVRHRARIVQIDPWNKLESSRPDNVRETDYIGDCLDELLAFAKDLNCHVQVLAHPAKMEGGANGRPPTLADISGSKNWDNRPDQGLVIHRPKLFEGGERRTEADLYCWKTRYEELGRPCKLGLNYDVTKGCFVSTDYRTGPTE